MSVLTQADLDWQESVAEARYSMQELRRQEEKGYDSLTRFADIVRRSESIIATDAKLAAYERVVEAAKAWRDGRGPKQDGSLVDKLEAAIDALTGKDAGK